ncbi:MAG: hypothetical protein NT162_00170, partial [Candidatus Woesebacteria bacterium]|nr:hypothetical protein [Candidatus Woesebacteria bacterium]
MKYLHLVPWSPLGNFGGYETIIRSATEAQKKSGHTVFVIGRTFGEKNGVKISQVNGVEYIEYVSSIKRRPSTLSIGLVGYFLLFAEIFYTLYVLTPLVNKLINKEKIDVVIFYGIHLFPMSFWLRTKKVITLLGLEVIQRNPYTSRLSFLYWFRKIKYNLFSGIHTYTHKFYFADGSVIDNVSLLKSFVKPEKVSYIPWGIEIEKYEKIS